MRRKKTKKIKIGNTFLGGDEPILVQSMLDRPFDSFQANIEQAQELESAGCRILRVAVPDLQAVKIINILKRSVKIPIVADIHFDYNIAIESVYAGADKVRINPGNIEKNNLAKVANICMQKNIPIRIGINSGSVNKKFLEKYGDTADAMVANAIDTVNLFESLGFNQIVISLKSSNIFKTIEAYEKMSKICDYPMHIGITEAGIENYGIVKSCVGIGSLLTRGIGDTIRVSLSANHVKEIEVGYQILKSLGLMNCVEVISCPTCGRCTIDVKSLALEIENFTKNIRKKLKIAVMGCPVNGPGEARDADFAITGAHGIGLIFKNGEIIKKVPQNILLEELKKLIFEL